ncbi:hypothetical protein [Streptococcus pneumoniae]|uniref:hypothetical protein n=1 Tax=Streptococcus pneumoniae TaxID=1313 RepID=UPI0007650913|nr:hypothetical protein [Streptococcus pneumoniae]UKP57440.1 hypothetical protein EQH23_00110 [Streptococcus pneumoniae]CAG5521685.1 Uncharacterised protein [Streptococcus pneumoniae]CVW83421.1 Uncharacterised protein [Streptococcus pneumoniae]CWE03189.1 Uncharacterised protein [Streptococcus pneumoniae]
MSKLLKKTSCFILMLTMCFIFVGNNYVFAENLLDSKLYVKNLSDGEGNNFKLIETGEKGFYIFDAQTNKCLEYSEDAPSPYLGENDELYYFGPLCYYVMQNGDLIHTITKEQISDSDLSFQQKTFKQALEKTNNFSTNSLLINEKIEDTLYSIRSRSANSYIPRYWHIKNAIYPKNENGTCGYTAACLVLNYWNKVKGGYVPPEFLDGSDLKTSGYTLQDKLVDYGGSNDSWGKTIRDAINQLCSDYSISGQAHYRIGKIGVSSEISNDRPAIIFGWLTSNPSPASVNTAARGKVFHAVTAYGTSGAYFICHYGWEGYEHVKLDGGLIGSCTLYNPD